MDEKLTFSYDISNVDRSKLLGDAATRLDNLSGHMSGDSTTGVSETDEGKLVRALMDDVAEFAAFPEVYPITITKEDSPERRKTEIPAEFSQLFDNYKFYWIRFPLKLFTRLNWKFNRIELYIEFNRHESNAQLRPKAHNIFPKREYQTLFETEANLGVNFNGSVQLDVDSGIVGVQLEERKAKAKIIINTHTDTKIETKLNFDYKIAKAKIQHTDTGAESIFWRVDGAEFFEDKVPPFIVIAQVPKQVKNVTIHAELMAYRFFSFATAELQEKVRNLPDAIMQFFKRGIPIRDRTDEPWDISSLMKSNEE